MLARMHRTATTLLGSVTTLLVCALGLGAWPGESRSPQAPTFIGAVPPEGLATIVIDAGHGGTDAGAIGLEGTEEKTVTLAAARALRDGLAARGSIRIVLTRDGDELRTLDERAAVANRSKADLYLTLHANASPAPQSYGMEVAWFLPVATGADRGTGPTPPGLGRSALVRWDRAQDRHLDRAAVVAARLGERLQSAGTLGPRGVYRGPLRLLAAVDAPAVLVEMGYLSNAADETRLGSDEGVRALAATLADAVAGLIERPR
jgi:N-acetylmuramoyl-L-alanine amidase